MIINKVWGYEKLLEVNEQYVVKKLHINKNKNLSKQYHVKKVESMFIYKGIGKIIINEVTHEFKPGDFFHLNSSTIHQVFAYDNEVEIIESSTPHLDDVVRLEG